MPGCGFAKPTTCTPVSPRAACAMCVSRRLAAVPHEECSYINRCVQDGIKAWEFQDNCPRANICTYIYVEMGTTLVKVHIECKRKYVHYIVISHNIYIYYIRYRYTYIYIYIHHMYSTYTYACIYVQHIGGP